jgi:mannitol-1-phosphate 5-dehydrogenase
LAFKKLVLFGAGKIGRSFIGQIFSRAGYEVVFIDLDEKVINALNRRREYRVLIKSDDGDSEIIVKNVRGVLASDEGQVLGELAECQIAATAVGPHALPGVCAIVAKGLERRNKKSPDFPLDIILAENLRDAAAFAEREIAKNLTEPIDLARIVGLAETSIGKMVPIMPAQLSDSDPLLVFAEPYNTLILDKKGFKNPLPDVPELAPKENMPAWVDRKSFIHNLGHAAAAYYGFSRYPELSYLHEVMVKPDVLGVTRATMLQSADILIRHYSGEFTIESLTEHIDDLLHRFSNKALGDTVYRVGQDLYRKLSPEDRLVAPLKLALKYRMPYDKILNIIVCAIGFNAVDEHGLRSANDLKFSEEANLGISRILDRVCGLPESDYLALHSEARLLNIY